MDLTLLEPVAPCLLNVKKRHRLRQTLVRQRVRIAMLSLRDGPSRRCLEVGNKKVPN